MKKALIMVLGALVLLAVVACGGNGDNTQDLPEVQNGNDVVDNNVDYNDSVIKSLAGTWDWPGGAGNAVYIHSDGTWEHSTGDTGILGNVSIEEVGGIYSVEFIVTHAEGAGAYGAPGIPYGYGVRPETIWFSGTYAPALNELQIENFDGLMIFMERR